MVILEETAATPEETEILTVHRDTICSHITEDHPTRLKLWSEINIKQVPEAALKCPNHKRIVKVEFASFGNPTGFCGDFIVGNCSLPAKQIVEQQCLGKMKCSVPLESNVLFKNGGASCIGIKKTLAIQVKCAHTKPHRLIVGNTRT